MTGLNKIIPMEIMAWTTRRHVVVGMREIQSALDLSPSEALEILQTSASDLGIDYPTLDALARARYAAYTDNLRWDSRDQRPVDYSVHRKAEEALSETFWIIWAVANQLPVPWALVVEYDGDGDKGIVDLDCCI